MSQTCPDCSVEYTEAEKTQHTPTSCPVEDCKSEIRPCQLAAHIKAEPLHMYKLIDEQFSTEAKIGDMNKKIDELVDLHAKAQAQMKELI
eukprot:gnl/Dysnectes_brevis/465_a518_8697.p1 GENE.gnl/Dysnectes_brevis/465_a518_8697~~gnl/Dysnectes_brevis/465_a518_8697.p1  ORF type:complete len:101 (+),score=20.01 gnl/Dysnectes_brevis/465_a518_8697:34-303(+)